MNNDYANKTRGDCRKLLADLLGLALRDEVDIITGDWNQAGDYLEECMFNAVKYHEKENEMEEGTIQWKIPGIKCEIRTIFINWPMDGVQCDMLVKEHTMFRDLCITDFGLNPTDQDSHVPQFS